jgi:uncharacterized protein YjbJ (UPF0337 family)
MLAPMCESGEAVAARRFSDVNAVRTPKSHIAHSCTSTTNLSVIAQAQSGEFRVDKNRTEGTKHEIKGAVKETVGKVTGNTGKQVAGNLEKNAGKLQKEVGKAADAQRDADKKRRP